MPHQLVTAVAGLAHRKGANVADAVGVVPLDDVAVNEGVGLLHHHPQAGGTLLLPVYLGVDIAEEVGVVEAAPAGVGAADGHAGVGYRGDQLGAVQVHLRIQLRSGHFEVHRTVRVQVAYANQELLQFCCIVLLRFM